VPRAARGHNRGPTVVGQFDGSLRGQVAFPDVTGTYQDLFGRRYVKMRESAG